MTAVTLHTKWLLPLYLMNIKDKNNIPIYWSTEFSGCNLGSTVECKTLFLVFLCVLMYERDGMVCLYRQDIYNDLQYF